MTPVSDDSEQIEPRLRTLFLECLGKKRDFGTPLNVELMCTELAYISRDRGLRFGHHNAWNDFHGTIKLHANLPPKISDLVWDLIVEGVIRPGSSSGNWLPFIHLTEFGDEAIKQPASPYDPEGYIKSIKQKVSNVDEVIVRYIAESAETLRKNCLLSSSMTLGCASEKTLLLVLEAYKDALNPADQAAFIKSNQKIHSIKKRHQDFKHRYQSSLRKHLESDFNSDRLTALDDALEFIFNRFRDARNEAGHPTGIIPLRQRVQANLILFPPFLEVLYELKNWLDTHKIP